MRRDKHASTGAFLTRFCGAAGQSSQHASTAVQGDLTGVSPEFPSDVVEEGRRA
jgi:hypothetical protein